MLRKETDIIHLAMGGQKSFFHLLRGSKKFQRLAKGGSKKFDSENFQLPSPPQQSIYEHSLNMKAYEHDEMGKPNSHTGTTF